jgi:hypothetical protein
MLQPVMAFPFLHNHKNFPDLLNILEVETGILAALVEKDYWIMHVLYGLQALGFSFELKGGTSLSKAFKLIQRFSEDIDIYIHPPADLGINENPKNTSKKTIEDRKKYYDWPAVNRKEVPTIPTSCGSIMMYIAFWQAHMFRHSLERRPMKHIRKRDFPRLTARYLFGKMRLYC